MKLLTRAFVLTLLCSVLISGGQLRAETFFDSDLDSSPLETLPDNASVKGSKSEETYLPILMYHQISQNDSLLGSYVISDNEFEQDLKMLKKNGYATVTVADVIQFSQGKGRLPAKPVMLTFDDGFESDYVYAFPLLQKYEMKAIFSIIGKYTDLYSQENITKHINYSHLTWDEISEMYKSGLAEFHNHTYNMHVLESRRGALRKKGESVEAYEKALADDLEHLNQAYKDHIGVTPTAFTCPFGCYNDALRDAVKKEGFQTILTSYQKINKLTGNPEELFYLKRYVRSHNRNMEKLIAGWNELFDTASCGKIEPGQSS